MSRTKYFLQALYSTDSRQAIARLISNWRPDIVHLHNLFPLLSLSVLDQLRRLDVPTVMTIHDYHLGCPGRDLFVHGEICERCHNGRYYCAVSRRCVNDRIGESLLHALICYVSDVSDLFLKQIDVFVTASGFVLEKLVSWGVPSGRIRVIPHFTDVKGDPPIDEESDGRIAYVGRLAEGKGVRTLVRAASLVPEARFAIIGDGPLRDPLRELIEDQGATNVELLGRMPAEQVRSLLRRAMFVVAPSECYETFGLSLIEAYALGKPVIASRIGAFPEIVQDGRTGFLIEPGNAEELAERMAGLAANAPLRREMGREARSVVEARFGADSHYEGLQEVYRTALRRRGKGA